MKYTLCRILGNDLPPRHSKTQTLDNLKFILENEGDFPDCEKRFVLNRIIDLDVVDAILSLLLKATYGFSVIPFIVDQYKELESREEKLLYLTNVNRARNYCVEYFLEDSEYVLPFDGGCIFREDGWQSFDANVRFNSGDPYFLVGQWRPKTYEDFLEGNEPELREEYRFGDRVEVGMREPTIVFGKEHDIKFNEALLYGQVDKVELIARLGVPGIWDKWLGRRIIGTMSKYAGKVKMAGWVARLPSGNDEADHNNQVRGRQRAEGMQLLLEKANSIKCS